MDRRQAELYVFFDWLAIDGVSFGGVLSVVVWPLSICSTCNGQLRTGLGSEAPTV